MDLINDVLNKIKTATNKTVIPESFSTTSFCSNNVFDDKTMPINMELTPPTPSTIRRSLLKEFDPYYTSPSTLQSKLHDKNPNELSENIVEVNLEECCEKVANSEEEIQPTDNQPLLVLDKSINNLEKFDASNLNFEEEILNGVPTTPVISEEVKSPKQTDKPVGIVTDKIDSVIEIFESEAKETVCEAKEVTEIKGNSINTDLVNETSEIAKVDSVADIVEESETKIKIDCEPKETICESKEDTEIQEKFINIDLIKEPICEAKETLCGVKETICEAKEDTEIKENSINSDLVKESSETTKVDSVTEIVEESEAKIKENCEAKIKADCEPKLKEDCEAKETVSEFKEDPEIKENSINTDLIKESSETDSLNENNSNLSVSVSNAETDKTIININPKEMSQDNKTHTEIESSKDNDNVVIDENGKYKTEIQSLKEQLEEKTSRLELLTKEIERLNKLLEDSEQEGEIRRLKQENEVAREHLAAIEICFNDVHKKYERVKAIVEGYKSNEEVLKNTVKMLEDNLSKETSRYESLKAHAISQIDKANRENANLKAGHDQAVKQLTTLTKRLEIKVNALQENLEQKSKECEELSALYDEITGKKI